MLSNLLLLAAATAASSTPSKDQAVVAELDRTFQLAVKQNDANTMNRILHSNYRLVLGTDR